MTWLRSILQNAAGEYEIGRSLLVYGGFVGFTTPPLFMAWSMHRGQSFDVTAYCLAYAGIIVALAPTIMSLGRKERDVAIARQTVAQPPLSDGGTVQQ